MGRLSGLSRCGFAFVALLSMAQARADIIDVTISVWGLGSQPSVLAFDFISPSSPPLANQVTLSTLTTDGTVKSTNTTGDVTGNGPWVFGNGSFLNELLMTLDPTGTPLSFSIDTTDIAADPVATPDSFSFFILDSAGAMPLVLTEDPTNALFQFELGLGAAGLHVFGPAQDSEFAFEIAVTRTPSTPVPEPSTIWLLAFGAAVAGRRRGNRLRGRG